jgi:hypothetical protein
LSFIFCMNNAGQVAIICIFESGLSCSFRYPAPEDQIILKNFII